MAQSDSWRKAKSLFSTTLDTGIGTGTGDTITPNSVTGLPTDTEITLTFDRVDSGGNQTPSKMERITGTISGGNLTSYTRGIDGSTEQAHSAGAVIEYIWNADDWNDAVDSFLAEHNQNGTHGDLTLSTLSASTITASAITSTAGITGSHITASLISASNITASNVTATSILYTSGAVTQAGSADHITITPGSSKLVKIAVLEQADSSSTTNTYRNNSIILTGWANVVGGGSTFDTVAITFGLTFSTTPVVVCSPAGRDTTATQPTTLAAHNEYQGYVTSDAYAISTTGCEIGLSTCRTGADSATSLGSNAYFATTWIAIGTMS